MTAEYVNRNAKVLQNVNTGHLKKRGMEDAI